VCDLRWDQVHFTSANLHVRRRKAGTPATHPLTGMELRALRRLKREQNPASQFAFVSERGDPFSIEGFARLLQRAAKTAGIAIRVHPHMLRHACGFKLANDGRDTRSIQSYLGHKNIQHTVRYTELSPARFRDFWNHPNMHICGGPGTPRNQQVPQQPMTSTRRAVARQPGQLLRSWLPCRRENRQDRPSICPLAAATDSTSANSLAPCALSTVPVAASESKSTGTLATCN
jgi:hypothetical protein